MRLSARFLFAPVSIVLLLAMQLIPAACSQDVANPDTVPDHQGDSVASDQSVTGADQADTVEAAGISSTILFNRIDYRSNQPRHSLWGIDAAGGEPWEIANNLSIDQEFTMLQIAPDCDRIMYGVTNAHQKVREIVVMGTDGSNPTHLSLPGAGEVSAMEWSPDGDRIAVSMFVSELVSGAEPNSQVNNKLSSIYIMGLDGAVQSSFPVQFNPDLGELLWSRDGKRFAFFTDTVNLRDGIYVVDVDGNNLVNVTQNVTINSLLTGPDDAGNTEDFQRVREQYEQLSREGKMIQSPSKPRWSPDSRKLAYFAQGADGAQLRTVDIATLEHRVLWTSTAPVKAFPTANIAWSPDGRTIAFSASSDLNATDELSFMTQSIWLVNEDGTNLRKLMEDTASDELAGWRDCPAPIQSLG